MTVRGAKGPCGHFFVVEGWDHVPAPITLRVICPRCSEPSGENPGGVTEVHMLQFLHPEDKSEVVGQEGAHE